MWPQAVDQPWEALLFCAELSLNSSSPLPQEQPPPSSPNPPCALQADPRAGQAAMAAATRRQAEERERRDEQGQSYDR